MVNKKLIKLVTTMFVVVGIISSVNGVFAEAVSGTQNNQTTIRNENWNKEKTENEVFGKIVSIDATNVTIQIATRKANNGDNKDGNRYTRREGGERPEITEEMKQKMREKRQEEKQNAKQNLENSKETNIKRGEERSFNIEDFVELTEEIKTINISQADFGKAIDFNNFKTENKTENNANTNRQNFEEMMKNAKDKTYADYKVGDYVSIECTDATYQVAKNVREGRMMGGRGMRKPIGDIKETQKNKQ